MKRREFAGAAGALPLAFLAGPSAAQAGADARAADARAADPQATQALHDLFDRQWQAAMQRYPEWATQMGDFRYNDRLTDESEAAQAAWDAREREWLREARAFPRDKLATIDRVSLDLFIYDLDESVAHQAFPGPRTMRVGALGGTQTHFANFMRAVPMESPLHARQLLARMAAYPKAIDDNIAHMRRGMALGWVPPKAVLDRALEQVDKILPPDAKDGPFYEPFTRLPADVPAAERAQLQASAIQAIARDVVPPLRKLRAFIADEYVRKAPAQGALLGYPDGARVYEMRVRTGTTTHLSASEVHAIGLREVQSIRAEMESVIQRVKFDGSFLKFVKFLNTDPRFFYPGREALLDGYRSLAKRIDAELPRLFAQLPRMPYGVRGMPAYAGPDAAEYYDEPALDGTRAGYFNANIEGWRVRPKWRMASLTAHESVPGHHLQIARSQELPLPDFRRAGGYNAFVEGWAVYAESLGREIGLYEDPYDLFGHLQWRIFRAARLVVDTGIHAKGWSRQQAIDYMVDRTGMDEGFVASEVDRYTSGPGQALGYMIGALKIRELRERARAQLGDRFDVRKFHNAVIDNGALPLDVLERLVGEWITSAKTQAASSAPPRSSS